MRGGLGVSEAGFYDIIRFGVMGAFIALVPTTEAESDKEPESNNYSKSVPKGR